MQPMLPIIDQSEILSIVGLDSVDIRSIHKSENRSYYIAAINWLTKYKLDTVENNIDKVKGLIEAHHHLCELEEWERVSKVLFIQLNTTTQEQLQNQLLTWGYPREILNLCQKLLDKLDKRTDAILLHACCNAWLTVGDFIKAVEYSQHALKIAQVIGDQYLECLCLGSLGQANKYLGHLEDAMRVHPNFAVSINAEQYFCCRELL